MINCGQLAQGNSDAQYLPAVSEVYHYHLWDSQVLKDTNPCIKLISQDDRGSFDRE